MMFSTRAEYGVRVMIAARAPARPGPGAAGRDRRGRRTCRSAYLEQLVSRLRKAELVSLDARRARRLRAGRATRPRSRWPRSCTRSRGPIVPMQCFDELGDEPRALQPRARRLRALRHEAALDPGAGRRRAGARADDARRAGEFAEHGADARAPARSTDSAPARARAHAPPSTNTGEANRPNG